MLDLMGKNGAPSHGALTVLRVACADGGDTNDGNFETETANSAILRLFTDISFVEEFLRNEKANDANILRPSGSPMTTIDQVFHGQNE